MVLDISYSRKHTFDIFQRVYTFDIFQRVHTFDIFQRVHTFDNFHDPNLLLWKSKMNRGRNWQRHYVGCNYACVNTNCVNKKTP